MTGRTPEPSERIRSAARSIERFTERPDEHALRARRRRIRLRRRLEVTALALCVVAATTGGVALLRLAFSRSEQPAVGTEQPLSALWPEHNAAALADAQARADAGQADVAWRTDAGAVTQRFTETVLGWADPTVEVWEQWTPDDDIPRARVGVCPATGCPVDGPSATEIVVLARLGDRGPGGIWSVVSAEGGLIPRAGLDDYPAPAIVMPEGRRIDQFTVRDSHDGLEEGTAVETGTILWSGCGAAVERGTHRIWFRYVHFLATLATEQPCGSEAGSSAGDGARPGAVFSAWPAGSASAFLDRLTGTDTSAPYPAPLAGVTMFAVSFKPGTGSSAELPAWIDQDPATLPACGAGDLSVTRPESSDEAIPPAPYGIGILVVVRPTGDSPCRVDSVLSVEILDGDGSVVPLEGDATFRVRGVLPSYDPDVKDLRAFWRLGDWCPPIDGGPYSARLSWDSEGISTTMLEVLADTCTQTSEEWVNGEHTRPPEGRGTPTLAPLG